MNGLILMAGKTLLDTSIVIDLFAGDASIPPFLTALNDTFVSSITIGELYYGALLASRVEESLRQIDRFLLSQVIAPIDADTARLFGEVKRQLRRSGKPIPDNDIWIASTAIQHQADVATRDVHFREIAGLTIVCP